MILAPAATAVKENATGTYAEKFCELGYITLAYDPRGIGESEGLECDCNPFHSANDLSAWVSFMCSLKQVDSSKIVSVGVCAGALPVLYETFRDSRVKAMGLIVPSIVGSEAMGKKYAVGQWAFYTVGGLLNLFAGSAKVPAIPEPIENIKDPWVTSLAEYYLEGKVGHHPNWKNGIALKSLPGIAGLYPYPYAKHYSHEIPVFMAQGDKSEGLEPSNRWYDLLEGDKKEKFMIAGANHADFYFQPHCVNPTAEKMDALFSKVRLGGGR